jgi:predicted esterase
MKKLSLYIILVLLCFNAETKAAKKNYSGFILYNFFNEEKRYEDKNFPNPNNLAPISRTYKGKTPNISLINGTDLKIIIYSHGTTRPQKREKCSKWFNSIPETLLVLKEINNTYFYYLCSKATDGPRVGSYISKRTKEIDNVLDQLISAGVKPENIFLAGYSAGGWASLMMMDRVGKKFNSAIVFAPTFSGPRSEISQYPKWRREARPRQIKKMTKAKTVKALIFAYEDDKFNRPQELIFLKEKYPNSVELVGYKCGKGHNTTNNDCRFNKTKQSIKNYFEKQNK